MTVLLINPQRIIKNKKNIWGRVASCMPPLGLGYIASLLLLYNIRVEILDMNAERPTLKQFKDIIKNKSPDYIGITSMTNLIKTSLEIAKICKEALPKTKIVLGGVHPTIMPEEVLRSPYVNYVVRGEGEYAFKELVKGKNPSKILGLSYKKKGKIIHNPNRQLIKDLDSIPHPAYHLLPMKKYHPAIGSYKRLPAISIISSRGCPGECTFCYKDMFGRVVRNRSAGNIIDEILLLKKRYGIKEISFYDDTFAVNHKLVREFCNIIIKDKIDITWSCFARTNLVNYDLLTLMKKSGCHQICYGVESGDEQILRNIKKHILPKHSINAIKMTKKAGIEARATFMLGNPGETEETIKKTIKFACELNPDVALFNITTPYPGTGMYNWAKEKEYLNTYDWDKYDLSRVVMDIPTINSKVTEKYYKLAYRKFYMRPRYIISRLFRIRNFNDIKNNAKSLIALLKFNW